jgi:hypothetical protein
MARRLNSSFGRAAGKRQLLLGRSTYPSIPQADLGAAKIFKRQYDRSHLLDRVVCTVSSERISNVSQCVRWD